MKPVVGSASILTGLLSESQLGLSIFYGSIKPIGPIPQDQRQEGQCLKGLWLTLSTSIIALIYWQ